MQRQHISTTQTSALRQRGNTNTLANTKTNVSLRYVIDKIEKMKDGDSFTVKFLFYSASPSALDIARIGDVYAIRREIIYTQRWMVVATKESVIKAVTDLFTEEYAIFISPSQDAQIEDVMEEPYLKIYNYTLAYYDKEKDGYCLNGGYLAKKEGNQWHITRTCDFFPYETRSNKTFDNS